MCDLWQLHDDGGHAARARSRAQIAAAVATLRHGTRDAAGDQAVQRRQLLRSAARCRRDDDDAIVAGAGAVLARRRRVAPVTGRRPHVAPARRVWREVGRAVRASRSRWASRPRTRRARRDSTRASPSSRSRQPRAALAAHDVDLRVFLLIHPPFVPRRDQDAWLARSVDVAFDCGATVVSLIPTRGGNGAMEALAATQHFTPPSLLGSRSRRSSGWLAPHWPGAPRRSSAAGPSRRRPLCSSTRGTSDGSPPAPPVRRARQRATDARCNLDAARCRRRSSCDACGEVTPS